VSERVPLILAISETPLLVEALAHDLEGAAVVRSFPAGREDPCGLVMHIRPDAVVVDRRQEADALATLDVPLIHVLVDERAVRAHRVDGWHEFPNPDASAAEIRNVLLGELYAVTAHAQFDARPGGQ
jgi:hypothetical protein